MSDSDVPLDPSELLAALAAFARDDQAGMRAALGAFARGRTAAAPLSLDEPALFARFCELHESHDDAAWLPALAREVAEACFEAVGDALMHRVTPEDNRDAIAEARKSLRLPAPVDHGTAREDLTAALGKQNLEVARLTADLAAATKRGDDLEHARAEVIEDTNRRLDALRERANEIATERDAATKRAEEAEAALTAVLAALPVGGVGSAATQVAAVVRDRDASRHNLNLLDEMRRDYIRSAPIPPEVRALVEACLALQDFVPMAHPTDESDAEEFALRGAMFDALPAAEAALAPPAAEAVEVPCPAGEHVLEEWEQGDPLPAWIGTDDKALRRKALAWCVRQLQRLAGERGGTK